MNFQAIIFKKEDHIATIRLNRPEVVNAINSQMEDELNSAFCDVGKDDEIRVLVLTGAGNAFCAGLDFRYREVKEGKIPVEEAAELGRRLKGQLHSGRLPSGATTSFILNLWNLDKPTIAMVNGVAAGAGMDLASACDIKIGSEKTSFTLGFNRLGLIPDSGGAWFLPRIVGLSKAAEILLTGDTIDAKEAERIGLLNKLVPSSELERETMALAQRIAQGAPIVHRLNKDLLRRGLGMDLETALVFTSAALNIAIATEDHKEGVRAFVEKRAPLFKGE
jgi:2-(1,2-epoxy-1,2-dihydrophenyl)acetyl-CoA isomerase